MNSRIVRLFTIVALLVGVILSGTGLPYIGANSASAATTVMLVVVSLECIDAEDNNGDEAQLKLSGTQVWYQSPVNNGYSTPLNLMRSFSSSIRFDLYDLDAGSWFDPHDHLGTWYAYAWQVNQGDQTAIFNDHNAHYRLTYRVVPLSDTYV